MAKETFPVILGSNISPGTYVALFGKISITINSCKDNDVFLKPKSEVKFNGI